MSAVVGKLSVDIDVNDAALQDALKKAAEAAAQAGQKIKQSSEEINQAVAETNNAAAKATTTAVTHTQQIGQTLAQTSTAAVQATSKVVSQAGSDVQKAADGQKAAVNRAILDVSRGVQDFASAGLMGVVNNVEGITRNVAVAMGKSADQAGAFAGKLTLVAVAAQVGLPLVANMLESIATSLGLVSTNAEKASSSVRGMSGGGMGFAAQAEAHKANSEFLLNRDDSPSSWNYLSRMTGTMADGAEAMARNMDRAIRATAEISQAFELGAKASRDARWLQSGSTSEFDLTTSRKQQSVLNRELFQAAIDKYGSGDNLRTRIEVAARNAGMNKTQARELYGGFKEGDFGATRQVESMLDLAAEKAKVMAEDFERATGSAEELKRIENDKAQEAKAELQRQIDDIYEGIVEAADAQTKRAKEANRSAADEIGQMTRDELERQSLQKQAGNVRERIEDLMSQRARSEVVGMSSVFEKNLNAGMEDPVVKAIEKQTEELKQINRELATLG